MCCPEHAALGPVQVGLREASSDEEVVSLSVERAMDELDTAIGRASELQARQADPGAPDRLEADRAVAAAARHAIALTKALKMASTRGI
jgi:hypothetical protein